MSQSVAKEISKKVQTYNRGVDAWNFGAKIFSICGIGWIIIGLPGIWQDIYAFIMFGLLHILCGIVILILCKKSKGFQKWADMDLQREKENYKSRKFFEVIIVCSVYIGVLITCFYLF